MPSERDLGVAVVPSRGRRLLTGLSAVLCVAVVLQWARSYRVSDVISFNDSSREGGAVRVWHYALWTGRGRLVLCRLTWVIYRTEDAPPLEGWMVRCCEVAEPAQAVPSYGSGRGGFGFRFVRDPWSKGSQCLVVPLWAVAMGSVLMPIGWFAFKWRAWGRRRKGWCVCCGYDLRASRGRCPECGIAIVGRSDAGVTER